MKENLAYLLWAMFRIKTKWLCKKDYHNYIIKSCVRTIEHKDDKGFTIRTEKIWLEPTFECVVCGKEIEKPNYLLYRTGVIDYD